ncbi:hypothetical protein OKW41_000061 [Paraburkholderia sp. UCT70]
MEYQDFGECTRVGKATIEPLRETIALKRTLPMVGGSGLAQYSRSYVQLTNCHRMLRQTLLMLKTHTRDPVDGAELQLLTLKSRSAL